MTTTTPLSPQQLSPQRLLPWQQLPRRLCRQHLQPPRRRAVLLLGSWSRLMRSPTRHYTVNQLATLRQLARHLQPVCPTVLRLLLILFHCLVQLSDLILLWWKLLLIHCFRAVLCRKSGCIDASWCSIFLLFFCEIILTEQSRIVFDTYWRFHFDMVLQLLATFRSCHWRVGEPAWKVCDNAFVLFLDKEKNRSGD